MLLIREVFVTKPGMASKFAKMMKETMGEPGVRIMTDVVGDYNTVVMEYEVESMADYEKKSAQWGKDMKPEDKAKMADYPNMYQTGRREMYKIW